MMETKNILITGASGNIGYEIIRGLKEIGCKHNIIAGGSNLENAKKVLSEFEGIEYRKVDFTKSDGYTAALENIDIVFLLRPPQLADIPKYFAPFIDALKKNSVNKVVFLSVQGAENNKVIPHHKLEKLILENNLEYAFLRPSYFMQNLTTTLVNEIKSQNKIFVPSGSLKFTWVDARDIGLVGAYILNDFDTYKNRGFDITGDEYMGFKEVATLLSDILGREIRYDSPNLWRFFTAKRKLGMAKPMIFVMIMLHYLPRLSKKEAKITTVVKDITGREPGKLAEFIERDKERFLII